MSNGDKYLKISILHSNPKLNIGISNPSNVTHLFDKMTKDLIWLSHTWI